jgi:hypothetical protein
MLRIYMPSLRKEPPTVVHPPWNQRALTHTPSVTPPVEKPRVAPLQFEAIKRDKIIRDAAKACPYTVGDTCVQAQGSAEDIAKRGDCTIIKICQNYTQYGAETEWPAHNRPLIVLASHFDEKGVIIYFYCSVGFLKKKESNDKQQA